MLAVMPIFSADSKFLCVIVLDECKSGVPWPTFFRCSSRWSTRCLLDPPPMGLKARIGSLAMLRITQAAQPLNPGAAPQIWLRPPRLCQRPALTCSISAWLNPFPNLSRKGALAGATEMPYSSGEPRRPSNPKLAAPSPLDSLACSEAHTESRQSSWTATTDVSLDYEASGTHVQTHLGKGVRFRRSGLCRHCCCTQRYGTRPSL